MCVGAWKEDGWLAGGPFVETLSSSWVDETSGPSCDCLHQNTPDLNWDSVASRLPVPAWPIAGASLHQPHRGPAGPARAVP